MSIVVNPRHEHIILMVDFAGHFFVFGLDLDIVLLLETCRLNCIFHRDNVNLWVSWAEARSVKCNQEFFYFVQDQSMVSIGKANVEASGNLVD